MMRFFMLLVVFVTFIMIMNRLYIKRISWLKLSPGGWSYINEINNEPPGMKKDFLDVDSALLNKKKSPILLHHEIENLVTAKKSPSGIPTNLIFNYKDNFLKNSTSTNRYIYSNVLNMIELHQGWNVIFDDDRECAKKILSLNDILGNSTLYWFTNGNKYGKYRSDLCRIVQLFLSGGVYIDNDIQLLHHWSSVFQEKNCTFVTVLSRPPITSTFQAIIGSTKEHPILKKALIMHRQFAEGTLSIKGMLGPDILYKAIASEDVCLLKEKKIKGKDRSKNRKTHKSCDEGVYEDENIVAYSRVVEYGDHNDFIKASCNE